MVFDSYEFAIFFLIVCALYFCLKHRAQNYLLLVSSYFFYGFWSWKFLALLVATQIIDYQISRALVRLEDPARRKRLMWLSVVVNMGTLAFFKYFNFFTDNLREVLTFAGVSVSDVTLNIVLPVGISFYTIQELTYIIDVYRKRVDPADNFVDFAVFVTYFPQLVAGPIERAERLLPQVQTPRKIQYVDFMEGGWLILWGLFKKVFVADRIAQISDAVFADPNMASGPGLILGAIAFAAQVYADFSGYSDMAVGLGRVMGFHLMYNFNLPYFSLTPSDFWRRWHISLSHCLRDNLYIPLGGNRRGIRREVLALMVTMTIGGLWHGAQWHYVAWGAYCGALLSLERIARKTLLGERLLTIDHQAPLPRRVLYMGILMPFTLLGMAIFRAENMHDVGTFVSGLVSGWARLAESFSPAAEVGKCLALLAAYEVAHYLSGDRFVVFKLPVPLRALFYFLIYLHITIGAPHDTRTFIYFQF